VSAMDIHLTADHLFRWTATAWPCLASGAPAALAARGRSSPPLRRPSGAARWPGLTRARPVSPSHTAARTTPAAPVPSAAPGLGAPPSRTPTAAWSPAGQPATVLPSPLATLHCHLQVGLLPGLLPLRPGRPARLQDPGRRQLRPALPHRHRPPLGLRAHWDTLPSGRGWRVVPHGGGQRAADPGVPVGLVPGGLQR
jgi:hypothetical protein